MAYHFWSGARSHSVLRDICGDWGDDLIALHYAEAHRAVR
jgi:hypothetical protein